MPERSSIDAAAVLHDVAERIPRRGVVFLISDLFDDPARIVEALHHFDCRQHELVVFHLMAEEELSFPFTGYQPFRDPEKVAPTLRIDPHAVRAASRLTWLLQAAGVRRAFGERSTELTPKSQPSSILPGASKHKLLPVPHSAQRGFWC